MLHTTDDLRIRSLHPLISPAILMEEIPVSKRATEVVTEARQAAGNIINKKDKRLLVIAGPCSIHDVNAAMEYGHLIAQATKKYQKELCIIMRVYFEKPRTTIGWKGLINDPYLDNTFKINHGLRLARKLLSDLAEIGVASGTEFLDTIIPQFISDLIAWGAIGARTTECQLHRELASGLSMPVGFKNGTDGNIQIALDAILSANHPHHFLSVTKQGIPAIVNTTGNDCCHVILRGASKGTNYDAKSISEVEKAQKNMNINRRIMIDCSHGNSQKDHKRQRNVAIEIAKQVSHGSQSIGGLMLESNLVEGKQSLKPSVPLIYGQSITDACIDFGDTLQIFDELAAAVKTRNKKKTK